MHKQRNEDFQVQLVKYKTDSVALVRHILHMILHLFAVLLLTCGHYLLKDHDVLYT